MTAESTTDSSEPLAASALWRPSTRRYLDILSSPRWRLIVALQDQLQRTSTDFWAERGVRFMHLPITTGAISSPMGRGSDSVPVAVDLMGDRTYLADSMQFMLEYGCRLNEPGVWYLMPSFRGEPADETHLNQFFHSEAEIAGGLDDVLTTAEAYLRAVTSEVVPLIVDSNIDDTPTAHLEAFLKTSEIPRLSMDDACDLLGDDPESVANRDGFRVLRRFGERRLMAEVAPVVWVTHHDHMSVPFYQAQDPANRNRALCADLLFGIGEVIGAGERHASGDEVRGALEAHEVDPASYEWYITMKDEFPMRTSGFGLGVERWLQWVLSASDIRELQLVPRLNGISLSP